MGTTTVHILTPILPNHGYFSNAFPKVLLPMCPALLTTDFSTHSSFRIHPHKCRHSWSAFHLSLTYRQVLIFSTACHEYYKHKNMTIVQHNFSSPFYRWQFSFQACVYALKLQISAADCPQTSINTAYLFANIIIPKPCVISGRYQTSVTSFQWLTCSPASKASAISDSPCQAEDRTLFQVGTLIPLQITQGLCDYVLHSLCSSLFVAPCTVLTANPDFSHFQENPSYCIESGFVRPSLPGCACRGMQLLLLLSLNKGTLLLLTVAERGR